MLPRITAFVLAGGLVFVATPAYAAPTDPGKLDAAKKVVTARIDGRLAALRAHNVTVQHAQHLSSAHKTTLTGLISADQSGLADLRTKVAGETTLAAVKADDQHMVDDFRIYILVGPKVRLTVAADAESAASTALEKAADALSAAIAAAKNAGKDTTKAEADLADLNAKVAAAKSAVAGQADTLLAIQPGPDATAITGKVKTVRTAVKTAGQDLHKAAADAKAARSALS
jgi:hypothetical protein